MKNIVLIVEYIGTNFCGFQKQKNGVAVQEVLEKAIFNVTKQQTTVTGSGRTDSGVHAMGQVVNFKTDSTIPPERFMHAINYELPDTVRVLKSYEVPLDFNARFSAKQKTYIYKVCTDEQMTTFLSDRCLHYPQKLDIKLIEKAAKKLVGEHDFSSFMTTGIEKESTVRTIYSINIIKLVGYANNILLFEVTGNGFLYNMVRIIVGTLLEIGSGKLPLNIIDELLKGNNRAKAGKTVGPQGLYLKEVKY